MKPTARLITWEEIEGFAESSDKEAFKSEVSAEGCEAFLRAHPEFPKMECTAERLCDFLSFGDKPEDETEALEKLRDIPYLSSAQRKIRDEKLRQAAIASRNAHRRHSRFALIG
jgi:hypothetical protein